MSLADVESLSRWFSLIASNRWKRRNFRLQGSNGKVTNCLRHGATYSSLSEFQNSEKQVEKNLNRLYRELQPYVYLKKEWPLRLVSVPVCSSCSAFIGSCENAWSCSTPITLNKLQLFSILHSLMVMHLMWLYYWILEFYLSYLSTSCAWCLCYQRL